MPSSEMFWMIMSTEMFASASGSKSVATIPGWSGTARIVSFVSFLSDVTPATTTASRSRSSPTTHVPSASEKLERT